jgi:putative ABC transport system substrate-binding protein
MHRRRLIALLGSAMTLTRPLLAQQKAMPVIGFLGIETPGGQVAPFVAAFVQGLSEIGYVEGKRNDRVALGGGPL